MCGKNGTYCARSRWIAMNRSQSRSLLFHTTSTRESLSPREAMRTNLRSDPAQPAQVTLHDRASNHGTVSLTKPAWAGVNSTVLRFKGDHSVRGDDRIAQRCIVRNGCVPKHHHARKTA